MSNVLGIWGEVPEENQEWYENTQIPEATKRLGTRAFHFQAAENMFPEEHAQSATSFTLYDPIVWAQTSSPAQEALTLAGSTSDATKNIALEARYHTCDWEEKAPDFSGDYADIGCLVMGIFHPTPAQHDAFFEWWRGEFVPSIQRSPDFLRVRLWTLHEAAELRDNTVQKRDCKDVMKYVMVYDFHSEDLPWEVAVEIGQSKAYQEFVEHDLQYRYGVYNLKRIYNETGAVEAEFNHDTYSDEEEQYPAP